MDENRKRKLVNFITQKVTIKSSVSNCYILPKQVFIFTHEARFFRELCLKQLESPITILEIYDTGIVNNVKTSSIRRVNIEERFPADEIIFRLQNLKNIEIKRNFKENFFDDCRIILENILKRKYYFQLKDDIQKNKSIRSFFTTMRQNYAAEVYQDLIILCDSLHIELHDNPIETTEGDKESVLKDFFKLLNKI